MNSVYEQGWFESTIDKLERYAKEGKLCKADFGTIQKFVDEKARYNNLSQQYDAKCAFSNAATAEMGRLVTMSENLGRDDSLTDANAAIGGNSLPNFGQGFFQSVADGSWKTYRQGFFDKAKATYAGAKIAAAQKFGRVENCANYDAQITSLESQIATLSSQLAQFNATLEQLKSAKQTCDATREQMEALQRQAAEIQAQMNALKPGNTPIVAPQTAQ